MRFKSEKFMAGDMPTVRQLNTLATIWKQSAEERNILEGQGGGAQHYMRTVFEAPIELSGELVVLQRAVGVQVGNHKNVDDQYNDVRMLEYYDSLCVQNSGLANVALRYTFAWSKREVFCSRRKTPAIYPYDSLSPEDSILWAKEHFAVADDAATTLGAEIDLSEVTKEDCDRLIDEAKDHFVIVDSLRSHQA